MIATNGDRRESAGSMHPRTGSSYSGGGLHSGSTGSGGGRTSPTTTSSLVAAQSHIQSLKDKHDAQTEALLAALADSQSLCKELRIENETLKAKVGDLETRWTEALASLKEDKELSRATRSSQSRRLYSPERQGVSSGRNLEVRGQPRPGSPFKRPVSRAASPTNRRSSTSSSIFPTIPKTMSLLLAERPESPGCLGSSGVSLPPSPTLVLAKLVGKQKQSEPLPSDPIPMGHKRSVSGTSVATSTNFSFETGSPGSLKLKPEHEFLLNDITQLSLVSEVGLESKVNI